MVNEIDAFFNTSDFAETASFVNTLSVSKSVPVIFETENVPTSFGQVEINNQVPAVICRTADITGIDNTCHMVIRGTTYHILDVYDDVHGFTLVTLTLTAP